MLTREAWNAFLKTLEEPPPNTVFVLATTEPHKVMPTIVDRCQRFDFQRPSLEQIAEVVRRVADAEGIEVADGAVAAIARAANGSFRDALGTLDQLVAYCGRAGRDRRRARRARRRRRRADLRRRGRDRRRRRAAALEVSSGWRTPAATSPSSAATSSPTCASCSSSGRRRGPPESFAVSAAEAERLRSRPGDRRIALVRSIDVLSAALAEIREGDEPRMTIEVALLRCARPQVDPGPQALAERLERLEQAGGGGGERPPPTRRARDEHPDNRLAADPRAPRRGRRRRARGGPERPEGRGADRRRPSTSNRVADCGRRSSTRCASRAPSCCPRSTRRRGRSRSTPRRRCSRSAFRRPPRSTSARRRRKRPASGSPTRADDRRRAPAAGLRAARRRGRRPSGRSPRRS